MHRGRDARLKRLRLQRDDTEWEAVCRRDLLRFDAKVCALIRAAMLRAGIDPACASALRAIEAPLADFADTPELRRADAEFAASREAEEDPEEAVDAGSAREWLIAELDRASRPYLDGSLPDFGRVSFMCLWGWAIAQGRLAKAPIPCPAPNPSPRIDTAVPGGEGHGRAGTSPAAAGNRRETDSARAGYCAAASSAGSP